MIMQDDECGPTSHSFMSQRLRLNFLDWGNAAAPTLVLLHGGRDHARSWDWAARILRRDWHVIAPDLRGHGDSAWSPDGAYAFPYYVSDLAQLVHQQGGQVSIVAHSMGGAIALRYAGLYPENVRRLVAIEGLGIVTNAVKQHSIEPVALRWRQWIDERRGLSARGAKRYTSLDEAFARMQAENGFLSEEQARHLTIHGMSRNEDGSWSWKFDNYVRSHVPFDVPDEELFGLWGRITCPVLLFHGKDSFASNPAEDGNAEHFKDARVVSLENAGHWVHHDRFATFMEIVQDFL
jgi:pimeloyl-ACP methyl ester carboxylesterase